MHNTLLSVMVPILTGVLTAAIYIAGSNPFGVQDKKENNIFSGHLQVLSHSNISFKNPSKTIVDNKACIKKEEANLTEKNCFE